MKTSKRLGKFVDSNNKRDSISAFVLSGTVHGLLIAALVISFNWHTESSAIYAELWAPEDISAGNDPNGVAKKDETPEQEPQKVAEKEDLQNPEDEEKELALKEAAEAKAKLEAQEEQNRIEARRLEQERLAKEEARQEEIKRQQEEAIALEKKKQEEARQREAERLAQEKLATEKRKAEEAKKAAEEKRRLAEEQRKAEEAKKLAIEKKKKEEARKRELARQEAERKRIAAETRKAELARLSAQLDQTKNISGSTSGDKSVIRRSMGSSLASYNARVVACIRPHIAIEVSPTIQQGQYIAEFKLRLLPNGEPLGDAIQTKRSGWSAYDDAVARAIKRCNPFPRPVAGESLPKEVYLSFDPVLDKN